MMISLLSKVAVRSPQVSGREEFSDKYGGFGPSSPALHRVGFFADPWDEARAVTIVPSSPPFTG